MPLVGYNPHSGVPAPKSMNFKQPIVQAVLKRFIRAALASAVASMLLVAPIGLSSFKDLTGWLTSLEIAGIIGVVTGILQAADKAVRWKE